MQFGRTCTTRLRHIPVIAEALNRYDGGMILVSHDQEFVQQVETNEELDLGAL